MIGEKIKSLRNKHGLKQSQLAARLGVVASQISNYERNKVKPSYEVLIKLADIFQVSLDYFYDNTNKEDLFIQTLNLDEQELKKRVEFYYAGEKLTDEEIKMILDYVRFLRFKSDNK